MTPPDIAAAIAIAKRRMLEGIANRVDFALLVLTEKLTVERIARKLHELYETRYAWEAFGEEYRESYRDKARALLTDLGMPT